MSITYPSGWGGESGSMVDINKLADIVVDYSAKVRSGDRVVIHYEPLAECLAQAVRDKVLDRGGRPMFYTGPPGTEEAFLTLASDAELNRMDPLGAWLMENSDARIVLRAPANTRALSAIPPDRIARRDRANSPISKCFMERQADLDEAKRLRWIITELPTEARAQDAGISLREFEQRFSRAAMLHLNDPAASWQGVYNWQETLLEWLNAGRKQAHILGPSIDVWLSIEGRTWINGGGQHNFPDGEVFTGPVEDSAEGWLRAASPIFYNGNAVYGAFLRFEKGRVVEATAESGQDFLIKTLDTDEGSRFLGEWGVGTNASVEELCGSILLDEKKEKTVHLTPGRGYPDSGSKNQSAIHWDMIIPAGEGTTITIDEEVIYRDGLFLIGDDSLRPDFTR